MKIKLGDIKTYSNGRLLSIKPFWQYELKSYKTPFLNLMAELKWAKRCRDYAKSQKEREDYEMWDEYINKFAKQ